MSEDLRTRLRSTTLPTGAASGIDPAAIVERGRRRRLIRRAAAAGGVVLAVAAGVSAYSFVGTGGTGVSRLIPASELTVDGMAARACGGIAPLSVLTATPGAEKADTPEARGLRHVIAHDPTGGESPQTPHNWVLIVEHDGMVTFGQRTGRVGIGAIVTLRKQGNAYRFWGSGGCGPVGYADGQTAENVGDSYVDHGDHLDIPSFDDIGQCGTVGSPTMKVYETATTVDVLRLTARPAPATTPSPGQPAQGCLDPARRATLHVPLTSPLGTRKVRNIGYVPARPIQRRVQAGHVDTYDSTDAMRARADNSHVPEKTTP